jgi:hypothetical protein
MPKDTEALVLNPNYTIGQTWKVVRAPTTVAGAAAAICM